MDIRDSFSRLKKKLKHPTTGRKPEPGKTRADASGERVDSAGSLPRPEPHIVAGDSRSQEENDTSVDRQRLCSPDQHPQPDQPESVPTRGGEYDEEGGEADADRKEEDRTYSHSRSDVEAVVGGGRGREGNHAGEESVERAHPSPSIPSIPHDGKPDGMWTSFFSFCF